MGMPACRRAATRSGANEGVALCAKKVPISGYEARAAPPAPGMRARARWRSSGFG